MADLNYHHLRYFWVVAREGTITRAADLLAGRSDPDGFFAAGGQGAKLSAYLQALHGLPAQEASTRALLEAQCELLEAVCEVVASDWNATRHPSSLMEGLSESALPPSVWRSCPKPTAKNVRPRHA